MCNIAKSDLTGRNANRQTEGDKIGDQDSICQYFLMLDRLSGESVVQSCKSLSLF